MTVFEDPTKLYNRTFGWGLGPYYEDTEDQERPDATSLSVFIDEEGNTNISEQLVLYKETDPITSPTEPTFSDENQFIVGLRKAINPFPLYGIVVYPITLPSGEDAKFPKNTPEGFVPCAGQTLRYKDGVTITIPDLTSRQVYSGAGDGATVSTVYYAPPGMAYMMRVPEGWKEMSPELNGDLGTWGTPPYSPTFGGF